MILHFYADKKVLECRTGNDEKLIKASSIVRNELNRRRSLTNPKDVVYAITNDHYNKHPYMPRSFPWGQWEVYPPVKGHGWTAPWFIPTNATRKVTVWTVQRDGTYGYETPDTVIDTGYGIHYSESITTLGCIRIHTLNDIEWLAKAIRAEAEAGHANTLIAQGA